MADRDVTEADIDASVAAAFGRVQESAPDVAEALRTAGYGPELVEQGLRMWASGRWFDFEDLATSLGTSRTLGAGNRPVAPGVTEASIARAAKLLEQGAAGQDGGRLEEAGSGPAGGRTGRVPLQEVCLGTASCTCAHQACPGAR